VDKKQLKQYREIEKRAKLNKDLKTQKLGFKKPKLILKVIDYFKPLNGLEIGNASGLLASAIKIAQPNATVTTLENSTETATSKPFDLIFSNSTKKANLSYFESCLSSIHNETFFIFKDIYRSKEMKKTWTEIKQHPKVTVTIDVFYYGFVFLRKEQQKEHFKIRI
jgi:predicted O-methyltransferase YrrM